MEEFHETHPEYAEEQRLEKATRKASAKEVKKGESKKRKGLSGGETGPHKRKKSKHAHSQNVSGSGSSTAASGENLSGYFSAEELDHPRKKKSVKKKKCGSDPDSDGDFTDDSSDVYTANGEKVPLKTPRESREQRSKRGVHHHVTGQKKRTAVPHIGSKITVCLPSAALDTDTCKGIKQKDVPREFDLKHMHKVTSRRIY